MSSSVSKIDVKIIFSDKQEAKAELFRHLAPTTISSILEKGTPEGRVVRFHDIFIYAPIGVVTGVEKARKKFERGEIAFIPSNGSIAIFLKNGTSHAPMTPLGKITSGIDILEKMGAGDKLKIEIEDQKLSAEEV